jgi:large subunit ribosomal protein L9
MKVVLLEKIDRLGKMGDVVTVKPGFARNFLLPKKKALRATDDNIAYFEKERAVLEAQSKDLATKAEGLKKLLEGKAFFVVRQSSDAGGLYGSVTTRDIAALVHAVDSTVNHHQVVLDAPIKSSGVHTVTLRLHPDVKTSIVVSIAPSEEEAKNQTVKKEKKAEKPKAEEVAETSSPDAAAE